MIIVDREPVHLRPGRSYVGPFPIRDIAKSLRVDASSFDRTGVTDIGLELSQDNGRTWEFFSSHKPIQGIHHSHLRAGLYPVIGQPYDFAPMIVPHFDQPNRLGRVFIDTQRPVRGIVSVSNAITFGTPAQHFTGGATSLSGAVDAGSSDNRLMVSFVRSAINNFPLKDAFTYNSLTLSELSTGNARLLFGYYVAPSTGSHTMTIDLNGGGSAEIAMHGVPMFGVNQATPVGTLVLTTGTGSPITSNTISPDSGDTVIDFARLQHTAGGGSLTKDASQTTIIAGNSPDGGAASYGSSYKLDATSMVWTGAQAGSWIHMAVPVHPAAAAAGNPYYYYLNERLVRGAYL